MSSSLDFGSLAELRKEKVNPSDALDDYYIGLEHIEKDSLRISGHGYGRDVDSQKQRFYKGDILFGKLRPYFRKVAVADFDGICSTDIWVVRPKLESDRQFVFYWMASREFIEKATQGAEGGRMPRAKWDWVEKFTLPQMNAAERSRIGDILSGFDAKISANHQLADDLRKTLRTIFKSWFLNFERDAENVEGESGLPRGWTRRMLDECHFTIESGSRPKGGVAGITSGTPSIGAESINGIGVFEYSKTKHVPHDFFLKMKKGKPRDFDVLLYKDGGKPGEFKPRLGMLGLGFPFNSYAINEHVFLLRSELLGQFFLYFWIELESTLDVLRALGVKSAIPGINQQDVNSLEVLLPSTERLDEFNELGQVAVERILTLSKESRALSLLRDSVLPMALQGEVKGGVS
jgi:type I restriction enzyme S subunit